MFHAHIAGEVVTLLEIKYWRKLSRMDQTEIVGRPLAMTTHNLQDVACLTNKDNAHLVWNNVFDGVEHLWKN